MQQALIHQRDADTRPHVVVSHPDCDLTMAPPLQALMQAAEQAKEGGAAGAAAGAAAGGAAGAAGGRNPINVRAGPLQEPGMQQQQAAARKGPLPLQADGGCLDTQDATLPVRRQLD